jgi:hypothetical protein
VRAESAAVEKREKNIATAYLNLFFGFTPAVLLFCSGGKARKKHCNGLFEFFLGLHRL